MRSRLPITVALIALACCVTALRADISALPVRLPGSSLDTSLRNEADRATRQAARWLADRQQADGSWGESNRVLHTSLALAALAGTRDPEYSGATARAAVWLGNTETNRLDSLGDHAWRLIALSLAVPYSPERQHLFFRLLAQASPDRDDASAEDQQLWREALAQSGISASNAIENTCHARDALTQAASDWPPSLADIHAAWRLTHLINRNASGLLMKDGTPIDWRPHAAQHLINSQKNDPRGGGCWPADTPDRQIAETAYGLLTLLEL